MYTKSQVGYEHPARGKDHCGECVHFKPPYGCEIVGGRIEPQDWCRRFRQMPYDQVMPKFGAGTLHSGSKKGPLVTNRKQAIAIEISEKKKAQGGNAEYQSSGRGAAKRRFKI